ncbi:hypothetical protein ACNFU2_16725 [Chryseobacterium sp. PTM-20240506]|uniref:hypothetical protein n=1 Tax=unclassified Chryseobacterium TaxID=2593645 RepID=UPI001553C9E5|nr:MULTISPECIES: hypothetical protein [unclassified Chryseobacterium]MDC8106538.1 hypothetical protein [Chryseobacterium sp. B21-037]MDQ1806561.1 hypothetical protein [Chryseobacterium sp. CKR4-1]WBV55754.1 hypothetical protein PFY10_16145 [Chryseobacterium daecheongense]
MKKFLPILLLAFVSLFIFSCDNKDDDNNFVDHDTIGTAFDITPTFTKTNDNLYQYSDAFTNELVQSDVVLIYLQTGLTNNNAPIWRLLPYTFFTNNNVAVDYSFDFSKFDIGINVNSSLNLTANPTYYTNKRFRVVILPANTGGKNSKTAAAPVDYNDYYSVIKYYNIDESKIKTKN